MTWRVATLVVLVSLVAGIELVDGDKRDSTTDEDLATPPGSVNIAEGPIGSLDGVSVENGRVTVIGWALSTVSEAEPYVELTIAGEVVATSRTGTWRGDVEAALGADAAHAGFVATIDAPPLGSHTVCADARSTARSAQIRLGCAAFDADAAGAEHRELDDLLHTLGREGEDSLAGVEVAIAVIPFETGELASWRGNRLYISASAAKAWWTAAALFRGREDAAAGLAPAVFEISSDAAAGSMIGLAGGIDSVNDFTTSLGMKDTAANKWIIDGIQRFSEDFPGRLNGSNHVDASDAARFFYELGTKQVLTPELTELLASWMRTSPRDATTAPAEASTISHALPRAVRNMVEHKAGWLRPGEFSVPSHLLGVGIVHPQNGTTSYAIALMGAGADRATYPRLIEFFQSASCRIYVHIAQHPRWKCPS